MQTEQEQEFLKHLYEEKIKTQELRTKYALRKLTFVISLLGIGSIQTERIDFTVILYIVPVIAIAFDLYISGEDYSVKRIGAFLGVNSSSETEKRWEDYVHKFRDPFAPFAMPLLTIAVVIICAIIIATREPNYIFLILWFFITTGSSIKLYKHNMDLRTKVKKEAEQYGY